MERALLWLRDLRGCSVNSAIEYSNVCGTAGYFAGTFRWHLRPAKSPVAGDYPTMIRRNIEDAVRQAMSDTPVVLLNGARQTGKTTLAQAIAARGGTQYFTLDDSATFSLAAGDPSGFVRNLSGPVVLDEIQKVPDLFPAIKLAVDKNRQPARFLLTGLANVMALPRLSESLAGRMSRPGDRGRWFPVTRGLSFGIILIPSRSRPRISVPVFPRMQEAKAMGWTKPLRGRLSCSVVL